MKINGHNLPHSFIEAINKNLFFQKVGSFTLKKEFDSFRNHLETELGQIFISQTKIASETSNLSKDFKPDGIYGNESEWKKEPNFIEDITDFSKIVAFAISSDGSPFCFDFRTSEETPTIIWWDDCYWRTVSPNFEEFVKLFEVNS